MACFSVAGNTVRFPQRDPPQVRTCAASFPFLLTVSLLAVSNQQYGRLDNAVKINRD